MKGPLVKCAFLRCPDKAVLFQSPRYTFSVVLLVGGNLNQKSAHISLWLQVRSPDCQSPLQIRPSLRAGHQNWTGLRMQKYNEGGNVEEEVEFERWND